MGWEYRLDCEGPQALWSGIWSLEFGFHWAACPVGSLEGTGVECGDKGFHEEYPGSS